MNAKELLTRINGNLGQLITTIISLIAIGTTIGIYANQVTDNRAAIHENKTVLQEVWREVAAAPKADTLANRETVNAELSALRKAIDEMRADVRDVKLLLMNPRGVK